MENKEFTLSFTAQEVDVIAAGLNELPVKVSLSTLQKLIQQVQNANQPVVEKAEPLPTAG